MYCEFYELAEPPFNLVPDADYLFMTNQYQRALGVLEYGMLKDGFAIITGDVGTGKTTLVRKLLEQDSDRFTVGLLNQTLMANQKDLMKWILYSFGIQFEESCGEVHLHGLLTDFLIAQFKAGRQCSLIIDEAHHLNVAMFECIRMISNINFGKYNLIQFILVGQPELRTLLKLPEMYQFAQRIVLDCHLSPLNQQETYAYIMHRVAVAGGDPLLFDAQAKKLVWKYSGGIPRLINLLCDAALTYGFGLMAKRINAEIIMLVINDKKETLTPLRRSGSVALLGRDGNPRRMEQEPTVPHRVINVD